MRPAGTHTRGHGSLLHDAHPAFAGTGTVPRLAGARPLRRDHRRHRADRSPRRTRIRHGRDPRARRLPGHAQTRRTRIGCGRVGRHARRARMGGATRVRQAAPIRRTRARLGGKHAGIARRPLRDRPGGHGRDARPERGLRDPRRTDPPPHPRTHGPAGRGLPPPVRHGQEGARLPGAHAPSGGTIARASGDGPGMGRSL